MGPITAEKWAVVMNVRCRRVIFIESRIPSKRYDAGQCGRSLLAPWPKRAARDQSEANPNLLCDRRKSKIVWLDAAVVFVAILAALSLAFASPPPPHFFTD